LWGGFGRPGTQPIERRSGTVARTRLVSQVSGGTQRRCTWGKARGRPALKGIPAAKKKKKFGAKSRGPSKTGGTKKKTR